MEEVLGGGGGGGKLALTPTPMTGPSSCLRAALLSASVAAGM